jgi:hypothetical protein
MSGKIDLMVPVGGVEEGAAVWRVRTALPSSKPSNIQKSCHLKANIIHLPFS